MFRFLNFLFCSVLFTARRWRCASAVYAVALCLSVTSQCSTKTAEHRIT